MRNETPRIKHTYIPTMRIHISVGDRKKSSNNNNKNDGDLLTRTPLKTFLKILRQTRT